MKTYKILRKPLTFKAVYEIIRENKKLELSTEAVSKIQQCREYLDNKVKKDPTPIYGVTTGFGSLCNTKVSEHDLEKLQENLMKSHACGIGEEVPQEIVRLMMLLKIQSLSYGHSGAQVATVQRLIDLYNNRIYPIVYQQGSLGASGDLAPLAHLCLPLIGLGEVYFRGKRYAAAEINAKFKFEPIKLKSKEGLALLNGTQFMSAYGVWLVLKSEKLSVLADLVGAISLEAFNGRIEPFMEQVHVVRPHLGQIETANNINQFLEGSEIAKQQSTGAPAVDKDFTIQSSKFNKKIVIHVKADEHEKSYTATVAQ